MTAKQNTLHPLIRAKVFLNIPKCDIKTQIKMSCVMRESALYICENKGPNQLSGRGTTDQRLLFAT